MNIYGKSAKRHPKRQTVAILAKATWLKFCFQGQHNLVLQCIAMESVRQCSLTDLPESIMTFLPLSDVLASFMCVDRASESFAHCMFRGWGCFGSSIQPEEILVLVRHCVRAYYYRTSFVSQFAFEWEGEICWLAEWTQDLHRRWPDWINSRQKRDRRWPDNAWIVDALQVLSVRLPFDAVFFCTREDCNRYRD